MLEGLRLLIPPHRAGEITAEQASKASKMSQRSRKLSEMSLSHYRKGRESMKLRSTQGRSEQWTTPKKKKISCEGKNMRAGGVFLKLEQTQELRISYQTI